MSIGDRDGDRVAPPSSGCGFLVGVAYQDGYKPLLTAAAKGHLEILKMLLEHGADLYARTGDAQTVWYLAEKHGHVGVVKFLRSRGAP